MSKTKQDILCDAGILTDARLNNPFVHKAMDEYAQQAVQEYKEKLKAEIRHVRSKSNFELSGGVIIQMIDRL